MNSHFQPFSPHRQIEVKLLAIESGYDKDSA